jgi:hypothetical protein
VCRLLVKKIDQRLQSRQERSCGAQSDGEKIQSNTSTHVSAQRRLRRGLRCENEVPRPALAWNLQYDIMVPSFVHSCSIGETLSMSSAQHTSWRSGAVRTTAVVRLWTSLASLRQNARHSGAVADRLRVCMYLSCSAGQLMPSRHRSAAGCDLQADVSCHPWPNCS